MSKDAVICEVRTDIPGKRVFFFEDLPNNVQVVIEKEQVESECETHEFRPIPLIQFVINQGLTPPGFSSNISDAIMPHECYDSSVMGKNLPKRVLVFHPNKWWHPEC